MKISLNASLYFVLLLTLTVMSCKKEVAAVPPTASNTPPASNNKVFSYLALGDSYTIGQSVDIEQRYPVQIAALLKQQGILLSDPVIIAQTGWTTAALSSAIANSHNTNTYNMVTLLIGVNNQFRGLSKDEFRNEFSALVKTAIRYAGNTAGNVFILSIPDYGVTPNYTNNRQAIAADIDAFNLIVKDESQKAGVVFLDITPLSRTALDTPDLIASDNLHFSGKMYAKWANIALPIAKSLLEKQ